MAVNEQNADLIAETAALIFPHHTDVNAMNAVSRSLSDYSEELIEDLVVFFKQEEEYADRIKTSILKRMPEWTIRDHLEFFPLMPNFSHSFRLNMVASLRLYYPSVSATEGLTSLGAEVIKQCKVFIEVALTLDIVSAFNEGSCARGLKDQRFVDLIKARADDSQRLLRIINDRNTADPALIESILDSSAPAVSEGML